jgi:hypothetical protein
MPVASHGQNEADATPDTDPDTEPAVRPARMSRRRQLEILLAGLGSIVIAVLMTWPAARHPTSTIPQDIYDPLLETWSAAWGGHALLHPGTHLWNGNVFYPLGDSYAFTDSLLGYAPLAWLGGGPKAALAHYNILYILAPALSFFGAYLLARQIGTRPVGALVAAGAFGYAPWRLSQAGHLHILSTGGIALSLAMLARGHGFGRGGYDPDRVRPGWAVAGWLVAAWQITVGFGIGLPFAYVLGTGVVVAAVCWAVRGRPPVPRRLLVADASGIVVFLVVTLLMALPYLRVVHDHPEAKRTLAANAIFSPPFRGFFIAPDTSAVWGKTMAHARAGLGDFNNEKTMMIGFAVTTLALLGLWISPWSVRRRLGLLAAATVALVLGMGTTFLGGAFFKVAYHLPGWDGLRTPGRLVVFATLALGLLAAGAVDRLVDEAGSWARYGMLIMPLLVVLEGLPTTPHPAVPAEPDAMRNVHGPAIVLPAVWWADCSVMYWSTDGFPKVINGNSGFAPNLTEQIRARTASFPDPASVAYLRSLGVRQVVVLRNWLPGTPYARALSQPTAGLGLSRHDYGADAVFTLPR